MTAVIVCFETSAPFYFLQVRGDLTVREPFAERKITMSSTPVSRRCLFATILGSKLESRSRATDISTGPASVITVLACGRSGNSRHPGPPGGASDSRDGYPSRLPVRPRPPSWCPDMDQAEPIP